MKLSGNTILITGGATGIGFALAKLLLESGNTVLICGRREGKLIEAQRLLPELKIKGCDVSDAASRNELHAWAMAQGVNVLINNAGVQCELDLTKGVEALESHEDEIGINFEALVYLTALFIPPFLTTRDAAIYNVSSGLAFIPLAIMPIYCATKAAIHSYTLSLREQLNSTGIRVGEIIPPIVDTDLDRGARAKRGQTDRGISPEAAAATVLKGMEEDSTEILIGAAAGMIEASKSNFDTVFARMNGYGSFKQRQENASVGSSPPQSTGS